MNLQQRIRMVKLLFNQPHLHNSDIRQAPLLFDDIIVRLVSVVKSVLLQICVNYDGAKNKDQIQIKNRIKIVNRPVISNKCQKYYMRRF